MDTEQIRYQASAAVVKLAERKKDAATSRPGKNAVRGHDDMHTPYDPAAMREAIEYFRIALEIRDDPTILHWLGMAQEMVGDFGAAAATYRSLQALCAEDQAPPLAHINKTYRELAASTLDRLAQKQSGRYDPAVALKSAMSGMLAMFDRSEKLGAGDKAALKDVYAQAQETLLGVMAARDDAGDAGPPAPADAQDASDFADAFGQRITDGDFKAAHAMLSSALKASHSPATLASTVAEMLQEEPALQAGVLNTMHDWPAREADDVLWAYVSISSESCNEAATVIVAREDGRLAIRNIEWGRP